MDVGRWAILYFGTINKEIPSNYGWLFYLFMTILNPVIIILSASLLTSKVLLKRQSASLMIVYRVIRWLGPVSVYFISWILGTWVALVYSIGRYFIFEKMLLNPILYFRAFQYKDGPQAFARIVAPTATKYGVVLALIHKTQSTEAILPPLTTSMKVYTSAVLDQNWQEYVKDKLSSCSFAIIDYSMQTQALQWELAESIQQIGQERTIVIYRDSELNIPPLDVFTLKYNLKYPRQARRALRTYFSSIYSQRPARK
jgi:hypothetical protein